jgi:hypothetical protein
MRKEQTGIAKLIFAGDSWALKGYTPMNYKSYGASSIDIRLADFWDIDYSCSSSVALSNLDVLDKIVSAKLPPSLPIIWIYTEPGRDYGRLTSNSEFDWINSERIFEIRTELDSMILHKIKQTINNPIALIGGLSDINVELATSLGYTVLHPSWQNWIATTLDRTDHFELGWGASDIGWHKDAHGVKPSKTALFAWDDLIKEWCMWEDLGYFCHEHPTPLANKEFANFLKADVTNWLNKFNA